MGQGRVIQSEEEHCSSTVHLQSYHEKVQCAAWDAANHWRQPRHRAMMGDAEPGCNCSDSACA